MMKLLFLLASTTLLFSCSKYNESDIDVANSFDFTIVDTVSVSSDGQSLLSLTVTKSIDAKPDLKVVLSTNKGILSNDNLVFTGNTSSAWLKVSQDTGLYLLKAVVKNENDSLIFQKTIGFYLKKALPDRILFETNRTISTTSSDTPTIIKTRLLRNIGLVTIGTEVNFRAYQLQNVTNDTVIVGRFEGLLNNYSQADGKLADITFFSDTRNVDVTRAVTIEATTQGKLGPVVNRLNLRYQ